MNLNYFKKEYALLSTLAVALSFLFIHVFYGKFRHDHILMIVAAQSIGGINFEKIPSVRLKVSLQFSIILLLTSVLGIIAAQNIIIAILCISIVSLSSSYWFRFFPENAADLIIPGGLIFFMLAFSESPSWKIVLFVGLGALIGLGLQLLTFLFRKVKIRYFHAKTENDQAKPISWSLSMRSEENEFAIRLCILLIVGFLCARLFDLSHGYWIPFTIMVLQRNSHSITRTRVLKRVLGTLSGVIVTMGIMRVGFSKEMLLFIVLLSNYLCAINIKKHYTVAVLFISIFVLVQSEYTTGLLPFSMEMERLLYTTVAGILVLSLTFIKPFILPVQKNN